MMAKTKESNAALLQRHYLQAAGIFHAQNQQVTNLEQLVESIFVSLILMVYIKVRADM